MENKTQKPTNEDIRKKYEEIAKKILEIKEEYDKSKEIK